MKTYEIYTNYEGMKPTELEFTTTSIEELTAWVEEFEARATCEESYIIRCEGEEIYL